MPCFGLRQSIVFRFTTNQSIFPVPPLNASQGQTHLDFYFCCRTKIYKIHTRPLFALKGEDGFVRVCFECQLLFPLLRILWIFLLLHSNTATFKRYKPSRKVKTNAYMQQLTFSTLLASWARDILLFYDTNKTQKKQIKCKYFP